MAVYKVTYFAGTGRAELMRLLLCYTGTKFEDCRVTPQQWTSMKSSTVFGQLPQLDVNGNVIADSIAGARYIARETGLYGHTSMEQAQADVVVAACEDFITVMWSATLNFLERDGVFAIEHKDNVGELMKGASKPFYEKMEKWLNERGGSSGLFVSEKVTWADIHVYNMVNMTINIGGSKEPLKSFAKLAAHYERIRNVDKIAQWEQNKPKSNW